MSESPQPTPTGASSTGSLPTNTNAPSPPLNERWATALGKLKVMGSMIGWESIRRGMRQEDEARQRWLRDNHRLLYGESGDAGEGDDMGHLVLGDYKIEHHLPPPPPQQSSPLTTAAMIGMAALSGGGLAMAAPSIADWMTDDPPAVTQPSDPPAAPPAELNPGGLELEIIRPNP